MFPCQVRGAARSAAARRLYHDVLGASGPRARLAPARARAGEGGEPMGHCAAHARGRVRRSHCHSGAAGITPTRHAISSTFADKARYVVDTYFSRDPMRWPLFADPTVAALNNFLDNREFKDWGPDIPDVDFPAGGPTPAEVWHKVKTESRIPKSMATDTQRVMDSTRMIAERTHNWSNPRAVENVASMPCDPGIVGTTLGAIANANLVHVEYSRMAADLEDHVTRQMATLCGMDPHKAAGVFTSGGTAANMYGYLLGIRKTFPDSVSKGLSGGEDYRFFNSVGAHYSSQTTLSTLGVNTANGVVRLRIDDDNKIDLDDLRTQLETCFRLNIKCPTILLTAGTTDTFAVDNIQAVVAIRNELCVKYDMAVRPHVHVDAAVGWVMCFFNDYDCIANPLGINEAALEMLQRNIELFQHLGECDSVTMDFHKWGYVPYASSMVLIKDRRDLERLHHDPAHFSYFSAVTEGHDHFHSTIECSRSATGVFGAYAALQALGYEGYQILVANSVQNAEYLRHKLSTAPGLRNHVHLVAAHNAGPSVGFRMYPPSVSAAEAFEYEVSSFDAHDVKYEGRVADTTRYHQSVFDTRDDAGLFTSFVQAIAHSVFDHRGRAKMLAGEKAVFFNPRTQRKHIDEYVHAIADAAGY